MSDSSTQTPSSEKIRLGGMALQNGVLVHGPKSWACAIRGKDGALKIASGLKTTHASAVKFPFLRGPARLAESLWILKDLKKNLPEARFPFESLNVLGAMAASAVVVKAVKERESSAPLARELVAGLLSMAPAVASLRSGETTSYHGAEHMVIGHYEHGEDRPKEHERCGSHLIGPMLLSNAVAGALVAKLPKQARGPASLFGSLAATGVATEVFGWMTRHPEKKLAKLLAKPGHDLQHNLGTKEPSFEQLQVAQAALDACLALERA